MASELIEKDGDTVDRAAALEVCLDLFGGCRVVNVADEDASRVDVLLVLAQVDALLLQRLLHLSQLGRLLFHLRNSALHLSNLRLHAKSMCCFARPGGIVPPHLLPPHRHPP